MDQLPDIFQYDDYRRYLKDYYEFKKQLKNGFSLRVFTRLAGYKSSSVLKLVMDGKRNLTQKSVSKFSSALRFDPDEAKFFKILVAFNQTESLDDKQRLAQVILGSQVSKRLSPMNQSKFEYWSHWYNVVIREMINSPSFREDAEWIAAQTIPTIRPKQAQEALNCLQRLGLVARDAQGRLVNSDSEIASDSRIVHAFVTSFHTTMIEKGKQAIERFERSDRYISAVTIAVSEEVKVKANELIKKFHREFLALGSLSPNPDQILQINMQLFPVTKRFS